MGVQPKDPLPATKLCFEKVDAHFGSVSALLSNEQVFQEAAQMLRQMKDSKDPEDERRAVAVAQAALASGHAMDVDSEEWPAAVRQMLRERQNISEKYWSEKIKKFERLKENSLSVVVRREAGRAVRGRRQKAHLSRPAGAGRQGVRDHAG